MIQSNYQFRLQMNKKLKSAFGENVVDQITFCSAAPKPRTLSLFLLFGSAISSSVIVFTGLDPPLYRIMCNPHHNKFVNFWKALHFTVMLAHSLAWIRHGI
jgi:hypothetical protein